MHIVKLLILTGLKIHYSRDAFKIEQMRKIGYKHLTIGLPGQTPILKLRDERTDASSKINNCIQQVIDNLEILL